MNEILKHYKRVKRCGLFSAPRTPIKPYTVKAGQEVVEVITGGMVFWPADDGRERIFRAGSIFWHQKGEHTVYRTTPENPYRCFFINFEVDDAPRPVPRLGQWGTVPDLGEFIGDVLNLVRNGRGNCEFFGEYLLGTLLRQMESLTAEEIPLPLRRVCSLLESAPSQNFSVEELAKHAGVGKSRLFTLFREHLHSSPHRWHLNRKLAMARELLVMRPEMPIKQIAESCGFETLEIFYRRFRQAVRESPGLFRTKHGRTEAF